MAITNFLIFNPTLANAESDAVYLADTTRTGGALTNQLLPSPLFNKLNYQPTIFAAAFATMMVNKGFTVLDSNFANLVAVLTNVKTSADFEDSIITVPYATSITFDAAQSSGFDLLLTGNVSTSSLINTSPGQLLTFIIAQDAVGGRVFPWPTALSYTAPICPQASSISVQQFMVRPSGAIVPTTPIIWLTASGLVIPPPAGSVVKINANGNISNQFAYYTEEVNATSGPITRNLYSAVGYTGFIVNVKNLGSTVNSVLVQPLIGGQTIDGFSNYSINPYNSISFISDGANWVII